MLIAAQGILLMLIGLVPAAAPPAGARPYRASAGLEGAWEGVIAETPARLTLFGIGLKRDGEGWKGTIDLPGAKGLPLSAIRLDTGDLHFELQAGDALVVFDAKLEGTTISGRLVEGDSTYAFDLRKLPDYPRPAHRVEAWRQDLDVVRTRFLEYDRSFAGSARAAFTKAIDDLDASLPRLNDQQIIVALSEAVALSRNAHTRLYLLRNRTELRRLPVRVRWFSDGLFVVRATSADSDTLACRVTAVAGRDPRQVRDRVARLFSGNESWIDYKSPYFMTSPEILYGLGLIADMEKAPFTFDCGDRGRLVRALAPLPLQRTKEATEEWRDLSPRWREGRDGWSSALPDGPSLPLYLRDPVRHYWFEYLEESGALYLQYNRSQDMPDGASFAEFAGEVEAFIGRHPIRALILDLRFNTGGSNGIAAPFMERLAALGKEKKLGRMYVITGRATFSAGISHAAWLRQHSDAVFVGEPIGDELDTWSEGGNIVLPNSGLTVHFTNGFHSLSKVEHPELAPYLWSDLDLTDLRPDILVRSSSDDYFAGRDPALEAALRDLADGSRAGGF